MAVMLFVLFLAGLHTLLASEQCVADGPHCKAALSNESDADDLAPAVLLLQSGLRREEAGGAWWSRRRRRWDRHWRSDCAMTRLTRHSYFGGDGEIESPLNGCVNIVTSSVNSAHVMVKEGCRVVMHGGRGCRGEERELVSAVGESKPAVLVMSHLSDIGWGGGRLKTLSCTCGGGASQLNVREDDDDHEDEEDREEPEHEEEEAQGEDQSGDQGAEDGPDEEVQGLEGDSAPSDEAGGEDFAEEHAGDEAGDESSPEEPEDPEMRTGLVRLEEGSTRGRRRRLHRSLLLSCTYTFYRDHSFRGNVWVGWADRNLCANMPHSRNPRKNLPGRRQSAGYGFVAPGCRLDFFDEKDCRGEQVTFVPSMSSFGSRFHSHFSSLRDQRGDDWNDRILSVKCRCS